MIVERVSKIIEIAGRASHKLTDFMRLSWETVLIYLGLRVINGSAANFNISLSLVTSSDRRIGLGF